MKKKATSFNYSDWWTELSDARLWPELAVMVAVIGIAWGISFAVERYFVVLLGDKSVTGLRRTALRGVHRMVFPFSLLILLLVGRAGLENFGQDVRLIDLAVPVVLALMIIRFVVFILRRSFRHTQALSAWENSITALIWVAVTLHLLGLMPPVLSAMDDLAIQLGDSRISLLAVTKLLLFGAIALVVAFRLSDFIEYQLMKTQTLTPSLRVGFAKFGKFSLITLAILLVLDGIGIDLTALTVFGGALGVGIGFGLQRITSNFISGFILVFDRSIRPGDVISVGDSFGWVQALRARYVVIRNRDGVDTLIPNEKLITSDVINWSYGDRNIRIKIPIQISYVDDPEQAMGIMIEAAKAEPRILGDPEPVCRLLGFGDNGINLELRVWITDPEEGLNNVRSSVNLIIWRSFKKKGITIPYPQRDVHVQHVTENRRDDK
ncbi:MAG TPA: mechanosensitive ion channel [Acidiferrobacteraceae bacterium]|nr:mechanosensitive ion channel [Acidiferrobacteraceae bacterium]